MKLLILGATGNTGKELLKQALEQRHDVTVLVRDPFKVPVVSVNIIKGNIFDSDVFAEALKDKDAVISALGVGDKLKSENLMTKAAAVLIPAMHKAGVKRLIFLSAFGVGKTVNDANFLQKFFFRYVLKDIYADKSKASEQIRQSGLDWTIVSPTKFTKGTLSGKYKAAESIKMSGFPTISRADTAHFIVKELNGCAFLKREVIVTSI